jgi:hypothetical protein
MNKKEWTIMLYMAGDNNLAVNMAYAMGQLKEFAREANGKLNLFVYYDGNSPNTPTLYCDFSGEKSVYRPSHLIADKPFKVTENTSNENEADKNAILNFVDWCVNKRQGRAERYAFILSGHSLGFLSKGLYQDETSGKSMNLGDLMYALKRMTIAKWHIDKSFEENWSEEVKYYSLKENADVLVGQPLDILGFDSCVMGMYEVGCQFESCASRMIVSEGSIPSAGWPYAKLLQRIYREPSKTLEDLDKIAAGLVEDYIQSQSEFAFAGVSVDMAAWDLKRFFLLESRVSRLAEILSECFSDPNSRLYFCMERAILNAHWKCQSYMYDQNVDLGDFCELLLQECEFIENEPGDSDQVQLMGELKQICKEVLEKIRYVVIQSGFSGGTYQYSNGISIFFPWSLEAFEAAERDYTALQATGINRKFGKTTGLRTWGEFLKPYLRDVTRRKSEGYTNDVTLGNKIRKQSPINFCDLSLVDAHGLTKQAGQKGTKQAGQEGTKQAGQEGTKQAGQEGTKQAGQEGTKQAGQEGTKQAGQEGTKQAGQEGTKQAGQEGTKQAGQEGTKQAGQEGTKQAGQEGTKQAGQEGTKMSGGGSSNLLFDSLRLWKNIEAHQHIYGFTHASPLAKKVKKKQSPKPKSPRMSMKKK